MFNTLEIITDKKHNTIMVECKTKDLAKCIYRKISDLWELAMEHYDDSGTYAYDLTHSGDLLANVPCNGTLLLWFDIHMGNGHDQKFDTILKFIKQCTAEGLGTDMHSLENMLSKKH